MTYLNDGTQKLLRNADFITNNEVAAKEGDIFIAINVIEQSRRVLALSGRILEAVTISESKTQMIERTKRILKG